MDMRSGVLTTGLADELLDEVREPIWSRMGLDWRCVLTGTPVWEEGNHPGDDGDVIEREWYFTPTMHRVEGGVTIEGSAKELNRWFKGVRVPKHALAVYWEMDVVADIPLARWTFVQNSGDRLNWESDITIIITGGPESPY